MTEEEKTIPAWMRTEEVYEPAKDHDGFVLRSALKLMSLLAAFRSRPSVSAYEPGPVVKLLLTLLFIVLASVSKNMFFVYCLLAGFLLRAVFLPGRLLLRVMRSAAAAAVLSVIILIPAVFLGSPGTMLRVSVKVFVSVGLIGLMSATTPWNRLTEALRVLHLPDLFIFILDITLKYIAILGEICVDMLTALRLRCVGRDRSKGRSLSGILGVSFLKSREMADEMYSAMVCRGFDGTYRIRRGQKPRKADFVYIALAVFVTAWFVYLERGVG